MPVNQDRLQAICEHLERIARGEKPRLLEIGELTAMQFAAINEGRDAHGLPGLESPAIVYVGRHHYESRSKDGYTVEDMMLQLVSGLSGTSVVVASQRSTILRNGAPRNDGYGVMVRDEIVLELLARKPRAEAYSAIPKGDKGGPKKRRPLVEEGPSVAIASG